MEIGEIDLHLIELRYQETRIARPTYRAQLLKSISTDGLLTPIAAIKEGDQFVLMDGYLRFDIVRSLGHDTVSGFISDATEENALTCYMRVCQSERHEAIEEGWLIDVLVKQSLSYSDIGRRIGKDKSWVQRRHKLATDLTEELQDAIGNLILPPGVQREF